MDKLIALFILPFFLLNCFVPSSSYAQVVLPSLLNFNQPKAITDALGNITMYTYDYELSTGNPKYALAGDPVKVTYPAVAKGTPEVNFTYNTHGQVVETSDANGKKSGDTLNCSVQLEGKCNVSPDFSE